jgi:hypothetical protein
LKRFLSLVGPLPFMALAILATGLALGVAVTVFQLLDARITAVTSWLRYPLIGIALATSYFAYGLSLLFIAPALNFLLGGRLAPYRGSTVSLAALRWYVHCTMTLVVRYSFLEFVTPTPFSQMYYRLMGMKIGRNVTLNSTAIADPSLIELQDGATIGGSANILAHYAQGGFLVIAPVKIGAGATIGMRAVSWPVSRSAPRRRCSPIPSCCRIRKCPPAKPGRAYRRSGSNCRVVPMPVRAKASTRMAPLEVACGALPRGGTRLGKAKVLPTSFVETSL